MSGPHVESGHEPHPAHYGEEIVAEFKRIYDRLHSVHGTVHAMLDAGVILPGPGVTGRIEKSSPPS